MGAPPQPLVLWPNEATAMGFANLAALRAHVGLDGQTLAAVIQRTGPLANQIVNYAALPPSVLRRASNAARVELTPAVAQVAP